MEKEKDSHYLPTCAGSTAPATTVAGSSGSGDCLDCIRPDVREALDAIELVGAHAGPGEAPAADSDDAPAAE